MPSRKGVYCLCIDADGAFLGSKTNYLVNKLIQLFAEFQNTTPFTQAELEKFSQTIYQEKLNKTQKKLFKQFNISQPRLSAYEKNLLSEKIKSFDLKDFNYDLLAELKINFSSHVEVFFTLYYKLTDKTVKYPEFYLENFNSLYPELIRRYINTLAEIDTEFLDQIYLLANDAIIQKIQAHLKKNTHDDIVFVSFTNRQSEFYEKIACEVNGTEKFVNVLSRFSRQIQKRFPDNIVSLKRYSITDIYNDLKEEETFKRLIEDRNPQPNSLYDHTKLTLAYTIIHLLKRDYFDYQLSINFLDDLEEVFNTLQETLKTYSILIPKNHTEVFLHQYKGEFLQSCQLKGTGTYDPCVSENVRLMASMCGYDLSHLPTNFVNEKNKKKTDFNAAKELNLTEFISKRIAPSIQAVPATISIVDNANVFFKKAPDTTNLHLITLAKKCTIL